MNNLWVIKCYVPDCTIITVLFFLMAKVSVYRAIFINNFPSYEVILPIISVLNIVIIALKCCKYLLMNRFAKGRYLEQLLYKI